VNGETQQLDPGEKISVREVSFEEFLEEAQSEDFINVSVSLRVMRTLLKGQTEEIRKIFYGQFYG
jgi:hypothetical protein